MQELEPECSRTIRSSCLFVIYQTVSPHLLENPQKGPDSPVIETFRSERKRSLRRVKVFAYTENVKAVGPRRLTRKSFEQRKPKPHPMFSEGTAPM